MLNKIFSTSLLVALFAMLIGVSSLNAQDMGKKEMMKKHAKMKKEMAAVNVTKADVNGDGKVYACSMGCAVTDEAGRCPKCEMKMNEMSVADAEGMLKDKGFKVADHSKMKKGCAPCCDKPCCAKKEMSDSKKCEDGCKKACCAKAEMKDAKSCKPGCEKACCAKAEMTDTKSCKPGCEKACCAKTDDAVSDAKAFNKVCPMSGGAVDASVQTVSYKGKNYGFCGAGCAAHFEADPAKYAQNVSECGEKFVSSSM